MNKQRRNKWKKNNSENIFIGSENEFIFTLFL